MPKLKEAQIQARKERVERGALALFRARGFHGVGLREVAAEAGVSIGNIYNHYAGKEELFEALLARLHADFSAPDTPLARYLEDCDFPEDLIALGAAVREMVEDHGDYLTLIYVDIAEFSGRHIRRYYDELRPIFRAALERRGEPRRCRGLSPEAALTAAYMQFSNYFIVERMIGARGHLGLDDDEAIAAIAAVYQRGFSAKEAP